MTSTLKWISLTFLRWCFHINLCTSTFFLVRSQGNLHLFQFKLVPFIHLLSSTSLSDVKNCKRFSSRLGNFLFHVDIFKRMSLYIWNCAATCSSLITFMCYFVLPKTATTFFTELKSTPGPTELQNQFFTRMKTQFKTQVANAWNNCWTLNLWTFQLVL